MEEKQPQPHESLAHRHQHSVESIITLLEWLVVAFVLALLFMAFTMQAFQIPTGSMAETLRGEHYQIRCFRCGYKFDVSSEPSTFSRPICPNCNYTEPPHAQGQSKNGDRIFVLKSIYQFFEPKRWDVVVFKNPTGPWDNYIKRLLALPGETVQLINGDLFIDGKIKRKPLNVQKELWMPVFQQDHQPLAAAEYYTELAVPDDKHKPWRLPFVNEPNSAWDLRDNTVFRLNGENDREHTIVYVPTGPDDFKAFYGYNDSGNHSAKPIVSDLMVSFYTRCDGWDGYVGAALVKYGIRYSAKVDFQGTMTLAKTVNGQTTLLRPPMLIDLTEIAGYEKFEFAVVDQQLVLRWGDKRFAYDLSVDESFKPVKACYETPPSVRLFASGPVEFRHIGIYRDIFYMGEEIIAERATEEKPFTLRADEFFVCGDNSNISMDGRLWSRAGIGNNGGTYREGVVPRDYMMGKAVMIYWSQAFSPTEGLPPTVPNLENLRIISGGSETKY